VGVGDDFEDDFRDDDGVNAHLPLRSAA
jgi:hypothetical protein